jgi:hypothetical protein
MEKKEQNNENGPVVESNWTETVENFEDLNI